jgi:predicted nucleotidyltransferase
MGSKIKGVSAANLPITEALIERTVCGRFAPWRQRLSGPIIPPNLKDRRMDAQSETVARKVKAALARVHGDSLAALYVFGSRARGDHGPDSDLDLAVILWNAPSSLVHADDALLDVTYPIEIDHGVHIQAWALAADEAGQPSTAFRSRLADTIRREGILL